MKAFIDMLLSSLMFLYLIGAALTPILVIFVFLIVIFR